MKRFQLAIKNIKSTDVVATSRLSFLMRSVISFRLLYAKKIITVIILLCSFTVNAQQNDIAAPDTAYQKVIAERTGKIINTLGIADPVQYKNAQQILADQYYKLNAVHDAGKATITAIKAKQLPEDEINEAVKLEEERKSATLKQLHTRFIAQLKEVLTEGQIEKVKDGMTYRVLPVTWAAYMDMLQKLTQEQKDKMYAWLLEARELAMDEGPSDKKHAVFGKYKGKINNYLSAEGYDMKKEGEEWAKRIQKTKDERNTNN